MSGNIELRGYEIARLEAGRWIEVSRWRPTDYALDEACRAAAWLNQRNPSEVYVVRPVVSTLPPSAKPDPALNKFRQTADEVPEPTQLELPFTDEAVNETPEEG